MKNEQKTTAYDNAFRATIPFGIGAFLGAAVIVFVMGVQTIENGREVTIRVADIVCDESEERRPNREPVIGGGGEATCYVGTFDGPSVTVIFVE